MFEFLVDRKPVPVTDCVEHLLQTYKVNDWGFSPFSFSGFGSKRTCSDSATNPSGI